MTMVEMVNCDLHGDHNYTLMCVSNNNRDCHVTITRTLKMLKYVHINEK